MEKVINLILEFMRANPGIPIYLILLWTIGIVIYAVYQTIKSEKKGKEFRTKLGIGDKAYFSTQRSIECEVIDTDVKGDDQFVAVKVIVYKKSLYPKVVDKI